MDKDKVKNFTDAIPNEPFHSKLKEQLNAEGRNPIWDFSTLIIMKKTEKNKHEKNAIYSGSAFSAIINPIAFLKKSPSLLLDDSIIGEIPSISIPQQYGLIQKKGDYCISFDAEGTLLLPGLKFEGVKKIKITENYTLKNYDGSNSCQYSSTFNYFITKEITKSILTVISHLRYSEKNTVLESYSELSGDYELIAD